MVAAGVVLALASSAGDSPVVDELPHITAGYSYLIQRDMRLNPEHPPLVKDLAALPLLMLSLDERAIRRGPWRHEPISQWAVSDRFLYGSGNDPDVVLRWARSPLLIFYVATALLLFCWAERRHGSTAAFIATSLWAFSPTVLGHSRLVTTDVAAALGVAGATWAFLLALRSPSLGRTCGAGLVLGLALLAKFSTLLLVPFLAGVALSWGWIRTGGPVPSLRRRLLIALGVFAIAALSVSAFYAPHVSGYPPAKQRRDALDKLAEFADSRLVRVIVSLSDSAYGRGVGSYLLGAYLVIERIDEAPPTFFLGEVRPAGALLYFPLVYLAKEPLAWIGLWVGAVVLAVRRRRERDTGRSAEATEDARVMIGWLVLYWGICLQSALNLGVRHLLPSYPFVILLVAGSLGRALEAHGRSGRSPARRIVWALLALFAIESAAAFPSFLAFFNVAFGGPKGGRLLVGDSNLDWGQDLVRLAAWARATGATPVHLHYFGRADPARYLGEGFVPLGPNDYKCAADFLAVEPRGGWLAVSVTQLQLWSGLGGFGGYEWLRGREPTASVGHSILVWRIEPTSP